MNINTLSEIIKLFKLEIIETGFHRDLQDYISSLPNNQSNIVALRDISERISKKLKELYAGDLPELLSKLFTDKIKPFTTQSHNKSIQDLLEDKEVPLTEYFQKLSKILTTLNAQIKQNIAEITRLESFINPYVIVQEELQTESQKAIISILFKDNKTTKNLKEFTKNIQCWNRTLPLYHQLLKSSSPEDIEIINVQNGSIDLIINLDIDVALDLVEIFKIGFKCFMAYLSYKKMAKPLIDSYFGNKKLIAGEKEREKELINNIGEAVKNEIISQHQAAITKDNKIEKNGDKKVEQIVNLVASHILKGNDFKLLSLPESETEDIKDDNTKIKQELREISSDVRQAMKIIPSDEMKSLLEKFDEDKNE